jgi:hypothetical protein
MKNENASGGNSSLPIPSIAGSRIDAGKASFHTLRGPFDLDGLNSPNDFCNAHNEAVGLRAENRQIVHVRIAGTVVVAELRKAAEQP